MYASKLTTEDEELPFGLFRTAEIEALRVLIAKRDADDDAFEASQKAERALLRAVAIELEKQQITEEELNTTEAELTDIGREAELTSLRHLRAEMRTEFKLGPKSAPWSDGPDRERPIALHQWQHGAQSQLGHTLAARARCAPPRATVHLSTSPRACLKSRWRTPWTLLV
jgi:hypothetical protein